MASPDEILNQRLALVSLCRCTCEWVYIRTVHGYHRLALGYQESGGPFSEHGQGTIYEQYGGPCISPIIVELNMEILLLGADPQQLRSRQVSIQQPCTGMMRGSSAPVTVPL
jgi:hypothetical protein